MNKNNKKSNNKKIENKKRKFFGVPIGKMLLALSVIIGFASCYVVIKLTTPPDLLKLDPHEYWGPYPMEDKPDLSIRPYKVEFSNMIVNDLKERLLHHRVPPQPLENVGFTYGFNSNFLVQVVDYWRNKYNFEEREDFFNQYDNYVTKIQGLDIHYVHVEPKNTDLEVVPILLLHGWPSSFREYYGMIPLLTDTKKDRKFVFEIIIPSLPGFGFSQAPARPGFSPLEMAVVMNNLMKRIGHDKYFIHGGDFGFMVGSAMATIYPNNVLGLHTNTPQVGFHPLAHIYTWLGALWPNMIEKPELQSRVYPLIERIPSYAEETGYLHLQSTKPDTIGAALSDSPAGLAAYILEKFSSWTNPSNKKSYDGEILKYFPLTTMLDNIMVYWTSNTITTSMRLFAETFNTRNVPMLIDRIPTVVPTCGIKFKHDVIYQPDLILKLKYVNYLQTTVVDDGGRFAAFEHPEILSEDIFNAVTKMKMFHNSLNPSEQTKNPTPTVYDFTVKDINGQDVKLDKYRGYVLLIVNVASQCGLTDTNYRELNQLHDKYYERGLRILAFPCNQFNGQEPGSPKQILQFTKQRGVQFDVFHKIDVNGENTDPLWVFLKKVQSGTLGDFIKWNFSKFIVDRNGKPVERLGPNVNPIELEPYLNKYL